MIARNSFRGGEDPNRGLGLVLFPIDTETLRPVKPAARFDFYGDDFPIDNDQKLDFRGSPFPGAQLRNSTASKFLGNIILRQKSLIRTKILGQDRPALSVPIGPASLWVPPAGKTSNTRG